MCATLRSGDTSTVQNVETKLTMNSSTNLELTELSQWNGSLHIGCAQKKKIYIYIYPQHIQCHKYLKESCGLSMQGYDFDMAQGCPRTPEGFNFIAGHAQSMGS